MAPYQALTTLRAEGEQKTEGAVYLREKRKNYERLRRAATA
jgi:hypothetical protein